MGLEENHSHSRGFGNGLDRREFLKRGSLVAAGLALPSVLAACGGGASNSASSASGSGGKPTDIANKTVVFATYGGTTAEAFQVAYFDPFYEETGVKVVNASMDPSRFLAMAESGRSVWDSGDVDGFDGVYFADEEVIQKMPSWVTRVGVPVPKYQEYFNSTYSYSWTIGYSESQLKGRKPESLADFWDASAFPGKRAWPKLFISTYEAALTADGVPADKLYPLNFEQAQAKLDELRPNIGLFYDSFAQAAQALVAGDVAMAWMPSGQIVAQQKAGNDLGIVWNQAVNYPWGALPVPNGAPNAEGMFALADFMAQPEREAEFAKLTGYGPPNPKALSLLDSATLAYVANSPQNLKVAVEVDTVALSKETVGYAESYGEWLAS